jgi:hypothetical protein
VWSKKRLSCAYVIPLRELREKEKFSKFKFKCETHNLGELLDGFVVGFDRGFACALTMRHSNEVAWQ